MDNKVVFYSGNLLYLIKSYLKIIKELVGRILSY